MMREKSEGYRMEEAAFAAWLPDTTLDDEGWIVRLDIGYTGRANSVTPQGAALPPFEARVAHCERLYHARGLPAIFRLTTLEDYSELDTFLAVRGYTAGNGAIVMSAPCAAGDAPLPERMALDKWLPWYDRFSARVQTGAHRAILERIETAHLFATLRYHDRVVAVGLGVLYGELLGLFDIVVAPDERGKGYGKALVLGMMGWGAQVGATRAYLQVAAGNEVAQRLYRRLGFAEAYRYHYRKEETDG